MTDSQNKSAERDASVKDEAEELNHDPSQSHTYYYDDATGYEIYHDQEEYDQENSKREKN